MYTLTMQVQNYLLTFRIFNELNLESNESSRVRVSAATVWVADKLEFNTCLFVVINGRFAAFVAKYPVLFQKSKRSQE